MGNFTFSTLSSDYTAYTVTGDINMDGFVDIMVGGPAGIRAYVGDGTGGFTNGNL